MRWRIDRLLYKKERSPWENIALSPLHLLAIPYGWAVRLRALSYEIGIRRPRTLPCPIISIGNLTVGGTGKTPLVMALAGALQEKGIPVAILSRGYKRAKTATSIVSDHRMIHLSPEESGDEPYLMAQRLKGTPVLVGKNRFLTGQMALQRFHVRGLLMDDGFQHLQLHRDLNILLIDSNIGFGNTCLLPAGILREPLTHLRRAHFILLTKVRTLESCQALELKIREIHPSAPIFHSHYEALELIGPREEREDLTSLEGKKVLAISGIVRPEDFTSLLRTCGVEVVKEAVFPDHHHYTPDDLTRIDKMKVGVDWIVTTEKDLVKLKAMNLEDLPIRALRIQVKLWEEALFYKKVMELFPGRG
jgi:tetraacyldisaccharide 4'-kinase